MSKQHYLLLALASVTLMITVAVTSKILQTTTGSQEAAHQAVLDKQFELTKKSLLNPLPHKTTKSQSNKPLKKIVPTTTKSTVEATALVEQSIEEFAELFKVKPKTQSREAEHRALDPLVKQELLLLDNTFSADQPSKVIISKSGKLEAIYPSFEVPNILSKNLSSLNQSTLEMIDSQPRLFGLNASASTKASKSNCGQKICTTTITKEFNGLPAWDHSLVVATNGKRIVSILGEFQVPTLSFTRSNKLNRDQISDIIAAHFKIAAGQVKLTTKPQQGIGRVAGHDYIGYRVNVDLGPTGQYQVSINSRSKKIVEALSLVMTVSVEASGTTLNGDAVNFRADQQGSLYNLRDDRFPVGSTTSVYSAASAEWRTANLASSKAADSSWDPAAVTSIFNTELLMDYYSDNHNYQAINSTGRNLDIIVNALIDGSSENAFWQADLQLMVFGKGNGVSTGNYANSLDVHAHEMTHGVISSTSNLRYEFQSGALNEAFSDFFGTQLDSEDWTLGEDIRLDGTPIRSLANPNLYDQPAHMSQYLYRSASEDHGGVHRNSGIPNRAMYLLSSGLSEENLGISIGRAKAGQIVWETMTSLPNDANFEDAARQMIAIAGSLYGSESIEQSATEAAWAAVGIPQENLLLSTINFSNAEVSAYNSILYLNPLYDPSTVPPEENTFNLYAQHYANSSPAFSAQSNFGPLNSNPVQFARPSQVILQDGSYTTLYRSTNGDLFSYNSALGFEQALDIGFNVSDITLSSDGQILVFSIEDAPLIYAYDYSTQSLTSIQVNGPDFSETDGVQGNVVFVDTLRFDPSSRSIVFDYLICSYQAGSDCSQAEADFFWSIGILDLDNQQIAYPFPTQPTSIDVGFPSFSNLTDQYITFDLIDYDASTESGTASYVIIYDQFERQFDVVGYPDTTDEQFGYYGMPSFSANDSGVAFAARDDGGISYLLYAQLENYALTSAQYPWLTLNPFFGYAPFSIPLIPFDRDPTLQLEASGIDFGGVLRGATHSQQLCANNTDLFPIRIMQLQDSSESMQWLGAGTLLSNGERVCGELTLNTSGWAEGNLSRTVSISHDGANSPTALSINAIISDDTDGDNILNYIDTDDDNDGVPDSNDEFPLDATESVDTDSDGIGNNSDTDDDGDGFADNDDAFPLDSSESNDYDNDGIGDNTDTDDGTWTYLSNGVAISITGCSTTCASDLNFPLTIIGLPVTGIGDYAFEEQDLSSIAIPNGINSIGVSAFSSNFLVSLVIPDSIVGIGDYAFYGNELLESVTFPSGLQNIGYAAFYNNALTSLEIPDSVTSISDYAFYGNELLKSVTLPSGLQSIGYAAFYNNGLTNLEIPSSVISIDEYAFALNKLLITVSFLGDRPILSDLILRLNPNLSRVTYCRGTTGWPGDEISNGTRSILPVEDCDGDGVIDGSDAFPLDPVETLDTDLDGTGNNADTDDDGDGVEDASDFFPLDSTETLDDDADGIGNNSDSDDDGDGVEDNYDAFPLDANEALDTDSDGLGNNIDTDDDGDGVEDNSDAFPLDSAETLDTDLDGIGDNADTDDDGDGVGDRSDAFPLDSTEVVDTDFDGIGNNADTDDDGDGVPDNSDALPLDPTETMDTDLDGIGDNTDAFPSNSLYASDSDLDGMPNAWEVRFGLDPYDPSDFKSDQDKDGVSAYDEFMAGTTPAGSLDIDGNSQYDALTDGLLLLRGMFGLSEGALISGAVASDAAYTSSSEIVSRIDMLGDLVDIDGNDRVDALTDGLIILRYLFGLRGDVLINGVIASDATITSADGVGAKMESLTPAL